MILKKIKPITQKSTLQIILPRIQQKPLKRNQQKNTTAHNATHTTPNPQNNTTDTVTAQYVENMLIPKQLATHMTVDQDTKKNQDTKNISAQCTQGT